MSTIQLGRFHFYIATRKRMCWLCNDPIIKGQPMMEGWTYNTTFAFHLYHLNEDMQNEVKIQLL